MLSPSFLTLEKHASSPNKFITVFLFLCYSKFLLPGGFLPGTLVRTFEGRCVPINKLNIKDSQHIRVLSANLKTQNASELFCWQSVNSINRYDVITHYELTVNSEVFRVAEDQVFFSLDKGTWAPIQSLRYGEKLLSFYGAATVEKITINHQRPTGSPNAHYREVAFDLSVGRTHTFFVGIQSLLVHNYTSILTNIVEQSYVFFQSTLMANPAPVAMATNTLGPVVGPAVLPPAAIPIVVGACLIAGAIYYYYTFEEPTHLAQKLKSNPSGLYNSEFAPSVDRPSTVFPNNDPYWRNFYDRTYGVLRMPNHKPLGKIIEKCHQQHVSEGYWTHQRDACGNVWEYRNDNSFVVQDKNGHYLLDTMSTVEHNSNIVHFSRSKTNAYHIAVQPDFTRSDFALPFKCEQSTSPSQYNYMESTTGSSRAGCYNDLLYSIFMNNCQVPTIPKATLAAATAAQQCKTDTSAQQALAPTLHYENITGIYWEEGVSSCGKTKMRISIDTQDGKTIYSDWNVVDEDGKLLGQEDAHGAMIHSKNEKDNSADYEKNNDPDSGGDKPPENENPDTNKLSAAFIAFKKKADQYITKLNELSEKGIDHYGDAKTKGEGMLSKKKLDFLKNEWAVLALTATYLYLTCNKLAEWTGIKQPVVSLSTQVKQLQTHLDTVHTHLEAVQTHLEIIQAQRLEEKETARAHLEIVQAQRLEEREMAQAHLEIVQAQRLEEKEMARAHLETVQTHLDIVQAQRLEEREMLLQTQNQLAEVMREFMSRKP
jgi:hypothetical protein